jgi:pimeloyl-ACP methyl ester carboxylesterase
MSTIKSNKGDTKMNRNKMSEALNRSRRNFLGTIAVSAAAAGFVTTGFADAQASTVNPTNLRPNKSGTNASFGPLKQIDAGLLNVGYAEAGPTNGPAVILIHGWPYDIHSYVDVAPLLASAGYRVIVPYPPEPAFLFWYQYYFATPVGKAGYAKYLDQFNKFIWHQASPKWNFDDATYDRTAASFHNPDHVDIVMHDYRWRLGLADGERKYDELEKRLAALPPITVPTITMEGDANGAIHAPSTAYRAKFSGKYEYRLITGGVGHNLPQEAPEAFAKAIVDVDQF